MKDGHNEVDTGERKLIRDEENRLLAVDDNGYVSLYWYDADGNRTVKEHHGGEAVWVNSAQAGQRTDSVVYSIYPSPYININGDHWTKHYYIGPERVASRTGRLSGGFDDLHIPGNNPASAGAGVTLDYSAMCRAEEDSVASMYAQLGVPYEPQRSGTPGSGGHLYVPVTRGEENVSDISAETAGTSDGSLLRSHPNTLGEGQVYYYHRDHLGSTQSVTDEAGNITQMVEYTPWGEVFVELKGDSVLTTPYLFNGKELDDETGLYYYGARYYDPKVSVWYSTDPMEMDYPWVTTYGYCLGNPNNNIDPNGTIIVPWSVSLNDHGNNMAKSFKSNLSFQKAMKIFANTSYGRKLISSFTPSNYTHYGVEGNGKYADYQLNIYVGNYKDITDYTTANKSKQGYFLVENNNGQPVFSFFINTTGRNIGEILETIDHEFGLHGSVLDNLINAYEKAINSGKNGIKAIQRLLNLDPDGFQDHENLKNRNMNHKGTRVYMQVMEEILNIYPGYKKEFEQGLKELNKE